MDGFGLESWNYHSELGCLYLSNEGSGEKNKKDQYSNSEGTATWHPGLIRGDQRVCTRVQCASLGEGRRVLFLFVLLAFRKEPSPSHRVIVK